MLALHLVLVGGMALYILFTLYFITGIIRLKKYSITTERLPSVSVIVAARNEEESLPALLNDLSLQDYPNDKIQFIIADDRSNDATWDIIQKQSIQDDRYTGVRITELSAEMTPKKHALTQAILQSKNEIILATDADCRLPEGWVTTMVNPLSYEEGITVGLSTIDTSDGTFFSQYQWVDFMGIMCANAGVLGWGAGWSGSGQNLGYKRKLFNKIGGFNPVADLISGDDMYLVQSISNIAPITFNIDKMSFTKTKPSATIKSFIHQHIRWASNSRTSFTSRPTFFLFLLSAFITNSSIVAGSFFTNYFQWVLMVLGIKIIFDGLVILCGAYRFGMKVPVVVFLCWSVLQPIYIPLMGVLGLWGKFKWKPEPAIE